MVMIQLQDWKLFLAPSTCFCQLLAGHGPFLPLVSRGRGCRCVTVGHEQHAHGVVYFQTPTFIDFQKWLWIGG